MKHFKRILSLITRPEAIYCYFILALALPNVMLSYTEQLTVVARIANILLPVGIYWLLASLTPRLPRTILWMFPFSFFAAFQLVLLYLYGRSVIAVDMFLNLVTTNPGEVGELLGNMMFIIIVVIILYLPTLVWAIVHLCRGKESGRIVSAGWMKVNRRCALVMTGLGFIAMALAYLTSDDYDVGRDLYPVNVGYNLGLAVNRTLEFRHYDENTAGYIFNAKSTHTPDSREVYVLVIGETSRAADWQLTGYDRPTNPRLSRREGLVAFNRAMSESNTTHKSVPMLLSNLDASTFNDSINRVHSLITAFGEAGFSTAAFSNQRPNHSYIDRYLEEADTTLFIRMSPGHGSDDASTTDLDLIPALRGILDEGHPRQLIVLHTYGSHFNYHDRYSREDTRFTPDNATEATPHNRVQLINAYNNSIVATDRLLDSIIGIVDNIPDVRAALVYTSDHGEDIYDDGRRLFLHASPCPSVYQIHVPVIVWTSQRYAADFPGAVMALRSNAGKKVSSTQSYFATALDLAGITTPVLDLRRSLASPTFVPVTERQYLNDHNRCVSLGQAGFEDEDFSIMKQLGL